MNKGYRIFNKKTAEYIAPTKTKTDFILDWTGSIQRIIQKENKQRILEDVVRDESSYVVEYDTGFMIDGINLYENDVVVNKKEPVSMRASNNKRGYFVEFPVSKLLAPICDFNLKTLKIVGTFGDKQTSALVREHIRECL